MIRGIEVIIAENGMDSEYNDTDAIEADTLHISQWLNKKYLSKSTKNCFKICYCPAKII